MLRVVIFSSGTSDSVAKLIRRIHGEVPEARVCGVLLERRPSKSLDQRVSRFVKNLKQPTFVSYATRRMANDALHTIATLGTRALRVLQAGEREVLPEDKLEGLCPYLVTRDCHSSEALGFVRELNPDLGLVYGTRILKPCLFRIPRFGSINIHKRKVPDYRGGGPVGLWEMLDGQTEIGVTVHEVEEQLDAGAIVNAATIPVFQYDTLSSLALKAHVTANDLLVRSVADFARDTVKRQGQQGESRMFKNPSPQLLAQYEKQLSRQRPPYRAHRGRPAVKLLIRTVAGAPYAAWKSRRHHHSRAFPVLILFHHLISDRRHGLGIPTDHFLQQVSFLREIYQIVSLREAIQMLNAGEVTRPTVVLTFDDGYGDNFLTLRAIREQMHLPITLFVSTGVVNGETPFPHDVRNGNRDFAALSWDQLRQMQREGVEIGSHTRSHFDCGSSNIAALREEIVGSKDELQRQLGCPIDYFSFPFGLPKNISPEAMKMAKDAYRYVFSAYGGMNFVSFGNDEQHLRRIPHSSDFWELALSLQGLLEPAPEEPFQEIRAVGRAA
jgi:methionyl-tRNA formyltransferase/peptidoglycan/xylan/chitin deacetylase (PgdA/CDA1 family)